MRPSTFFIVRDERQPLNSSLGDTTPHNPPSKTNLFVPPLFGRDLMGHRATVG